MGCVARLHNNPSYKQMRFRRRPRTSSRPLIPDPGHNSHLRHGIWLGTSSLNRRGKQCFQKMYDRATRVELYMAPRCSREICQLSHQHCRRSSTRQAA